MGKQGIFPLPLDGIPAWQPPPFRGSCPALADLLKASIAKGLKDEPSACTVAYACASAFSRRPTGRRRCDPPLPVSQRKPGDFAAICGLPNFDFAIRTAGWPRSSAPSRPRAASQSLLPELPARWSRACRFGRWGRRSPSYARAGNVDSRRLLLRRLRSRVARLSASQGCPDGSHRVQRGLKSPRWLGLGRALLCTPVRLAPGPNCFPIAAPPYLGSTSRPLRAPATPASRVAAANAQSQGE